MKFTKDQTLLSAGDLSNHIACAHLSYLDLALAKQRIEAPDFRDPTLAVLQERGLAFEQGYLQSLREQGKQIAEPDSEEEEVSSQRTISSMQAGVDVIYQATLRSGRWQGRADFLLKVGKPSRLGAWSYEVIDSKLARETRAGTILQLCLYSQLVEEIQEFRPEYMHVITPENEFSQHTYRLDDFLAYYRFVKHRLEDLVAKDKQPIPTYPNPVAHCDVCRWWQTCNTKRRNDDHLSLVAGLSGSQAVEIKKWDVETLEKFAQLPLPLSHKPEKGAVETYERLREQARVQLESREKQKPVFERLDMEEGKGFFNLPAPSEGDIFFDFEGDPYAGTSGLEYLFGFVFNDEPGHYECYWALTPEKEREAFERFVDMVMACWEQYPDLHIYHYTAYEPAGLKRLMGKYATRENEIDQMLRAGLFIDLHSITKQALRAGVEAYSLKELEKFHGFVRNMELREAALQLRALEGFIERNNIMDIPPESIRAVETYNKDDCLSTKSLRDWLEEQREWLIQEGERIPRPEIKEGEASDALTEYQQKIQPVFESLMAGVPADPVERTPQQQANWILAHMLDWYRREKKAAWWEYFRLCDLPNDELTEEKAAISGLRFTRERRQEAKSVIDLYTFPVQECDLKEGDDLRTGDGHALGKVISIDTVSGRIEIKKGPKNADIHPASIFRHSMVSDKVKEEAIFRTATWVVRNGIDAEGPYGAGRDLLLNRPPRTRLDFESESSSQENAIAWIQALDNGVLPIQGPPGSGKSHTAANMILSLIQSGKRVGITALSHKVIVGLMQKVVKFAGEQSVSVQCLRKVTTVSKVPAQQIEEVTSYDKIFAALKSNAVNIVGGTPWLWAREEMAGAVDVLFVDEAGQLSLIDTVAVSQAAKNIVLLGDPQQLKQPQQGSHPEGTELSALEHILRDHRTSETAKTIPPDKGIFLDQTWRLHPNICAFISELFYESKLHSRPNLVNQVISGNTSFTGSGLWFQPVHHDGNQNSSAQEADTVLAIVRELTKGEVFFTNGENLKSVLLEKDILVIAPYNAQVSLLSSRLPDVVQVGTVDKFQGQEAPVVIFSMATSSPEDAPRGMEFLYSLNRFNVAASRAKAAFILVANPRLFEPDCKNVEQMKLANAFCRFLELASG